MNGEPPWYTFPIGNVGLGYWLIGRNPDHPEKWYLAMVNGRREYFGPYDSPHEAAYAVAHFKTGNQMWDSIPHSAFSVISDDVGKSNLDLLKSWTRHDEYPRPTAPVDEDEEDA
jgi:hypothetical protein